MQKLKSNESSLARKKLLPLFLVYGTLILLLIVSEILSPGFLLPRHLETVLRQVAFLGIVSLGQTLVILTGGINLSVRYTLVLANVVTAQTMAGSDANAGTALLIAIAIGAAVGLLNGAGIYLLNIPPMIMTRRSVRPCTAWRISIATARPRATRRLSLPISQTAGWANCSRKAVFCAARSISTARS